MNLSYGSSAYHSLGATNSGIGCEYAHGIIAALQRAIERRP